MTIPSCDCLGGNVEYMCKYTHVYSYLSMLFVLHNHCYAVAVLFTNMSQLSVEVEM